MRLAGPAWVLVLFLAAQPGGKAQISSFQVTLEGELIKASWSFDNGFDADLLERMQTGLPTGFDFRFKLVRPRRRWFDRDVATASLQVVATYNAVNREYLVNYKQNGKLIESKVLLDEGELRTAMTRFEDIEIFNTQDVRTTNRLHVRARVALGSRNLFFLIPTTIKTDWVESRKFRLSRDSPEEAD